MAQTKEFIVGISGIEGSTKYTPQAAKVNGVSGRLWIRRRCDGRSWGYEGRVFVNKYAEEIEVHATVDEALE